MRTDSRVNRDRIMTAARRLFVEVGDERVTMARIARGADVTVTTLYRHFPNREHLVAEAYGHQWSDCARALGDAQDEPSAGPALFRLLRRLCDDQVRDRGFTPALVAALLTGEGVASPQADPVRLMTALIERARGEGSVRAGLDLDDVRILVAGNQGVIESAGPQASRRYVDHMLRAFAPA